MGNIFMLARNRCVGKMQAVDSGELAVPHQNGLPTYEELKTMSESELVEKIDQLIAVQSVEAQHSQDQHINSDQRRFQKGDGI